MNAAGVRIVDRQVALRPAGRLQRREDLREELRNVLEGGTCWKNDGDPSRSDPTWLRMIPLRVELPAA